MIVMLRQIIQMNLSIFHIVVSLIENSHYRVIVSYLLKDTKWELLSANQNKNAFLTPYYAEHIRYEASNTGNFLGENK